MQAMSLQNRRFVSVTEAANIIGCTGGRVRQLLIAGELNGEKLHPRAWAIKLADVQKYAKAPAKRGRPRNADPR